MARIQYHPGIVPLVNEHFGFTFQPHSSGQSITASKKNNRFRNVKQSVRQQGLMKAIRNWRNLSAPSKANWNTFASTYPQASRRNPAIFLTGYQLFLKRNHYCFLNHGIDCDFMLEPQLSALAGPEINLSIKAGDNSLDVTELYISNYGILPSSGQFVLIRVFPMAVDSGQFFEPIFATIKVDTVYVDGLFVSFDLTGLNENLTFSVYLSKVVHQSIFYVGSKVRYMGCFTPKTFKSLTDTPASYVGQAGKVPVINPGEDGFVFETPGGGGISCEDLPDCPEIIQINEQLQAVSEIVSKEFNTSVPTVGYGLLYNFFAANDARLSSGGYRLPTLTEAIDFRTYYGGSALAGGAYKSTDLADWQAPNAGATNLSKFFLKGSGKRNYSTGFFSLLNQAAYCWTSTVGATTYARIIFNCVYSSANTTLDLYRHTSGLSVRFIKPAPGVADGTINSYTGNDGRVYRTVASNGFFVMADCLAETKFNDGSLISEITDNAEWVALSTPALCAFNNDWGNV